MVIRVVTRQECMCLGGELLSWSCINLFLNLTFWNSITMCHGAMFPTSNSISGYI